MAHTDIISLLEVYFEIIAKSGNRIFRRMYRIPDVRKRFVGRQSG